MPDRPTSLVFDRIADRYDETRGGPERGERFAAALEPLFAGRGRALEIGVGTGVIAHPLARRGRDVVGVDLSRAMLQAARARLGGRVAVADALQLPFGDASIGDAYSVWVLHLVSDVAAVLREVARVLRPGGRYLVVDTSSGGSFGDTDVDTALERMHRELQGPMRQDDPDRVAALACDVGLVDVGRTVIDTAYRDETPAERVRLTEERVYSMLWDLDEQTWARVVVPTIAALRALPDQDRPRSRRSVHGVLALERT